MLNKIYLAWRQAQSLSHLSVKWHLHGNDNTDQEANSSLVPTKSLVFFGNTINPLQTFWHLIFYPTLMGLKIFYTTFFFKSRTFQKQGIPTSGLNYFPLKKG